jgi:hypothetical protein
MAIDFSLFRRKQKVTKASPSASLEDPLSKEKTSNGKTIFLINNFYSSALKDSIFQRLIYF